VNNSISKTPIIPRANNWDTLDISDTTNNVIDLTSRILWENHNMHDQLISDIENDPRFKSYVLDFIDTHQPLTGWQEWEIYKIMYWENNYIVAKKRYDNDSEREYRLQKDAYQISLDSLSWVKVPKPMQEFHDSDNWYLIMEFIEWKTFYTMVWQEIVNSHLISIAKKYIIDKYASDNQLFDAHMNELDMFISHYWDGSKSKIEFKDDFESINWMRVICDILYELWYLKWTFNKAEVNPNNPSEKNYVIETWLLERFMSEISLFKNEDYKNNIKNLRIFLDDLHESGLYHRDIWKNFRNIIFWPKWVYLIDFWRSITCKQPDSNYDYDGWKYANDYDIVWNIQKTKVKNLDEENNEINLINEDLIIENWNKLWLNINKWLISKYSMNAKNIDLSKILNDFINKKDKAYNWFIYNTGSNEESKSSSNQWDINSTNIGKVKLFILISLLSNDRLNILESNIKQYIELPKRTRKYKYSKLFNDYIDVIKD